MLFSIAQMLSGNVPYGARTFLEQLLARDRPTDSIHVKANGMFGLQHFDHHAGL